MPLVGCASYCWGVCDGGYMNVKEWAMCYVIGGSFKEVGTEGVYWTLLGFCDLLLAACWCCEGFRTQQNCLVLRSICCPAVSKSSSMYEDAVKTNPVVLHTILYVSYFSPLYSCFSIHADVFWVPFPPQLTSVMWFLPFPDVFYAPNCWSAFMKVCVPINTLVCCV